MSSLVICPCSNPKPCFGVPRYLLGGLVRFRGGGVRSVSGRIVDSITAGRVDRFTELGLPSAPITRMITDSLASAIASRSVGHANVELSVRSVRSVLSGFEVKVAQPPWSFSRQGSSKWGHCSPAVRPCEELSHGRPTRRKGRRELQRAQRAAKGAEGYAGCRGQR